MRLLVGPDAVALIPRSGGLRKIRFESPRRGERAGAWITCYWVTARSQIHLLLAYAKNQQDDLSEEQLKALRTLVQQELG